MKLLRHHAPVLACEAAAHAVRSCAEAVLHGELAPWAQLHHRARQALDRADGEPPGRVISAGSWRDDMTFERLAAALPAQLGSSLLAGFEWYTCRGAFFHTDAHYGDVLFGAWCVLGPPRELVFSRLATRLPAGPAALTVFDPFEPHAVLRPGVAGYSHEDYVDGAPSVYLGFELALSPHVRQSFGIGPAPAGGATLSSRNRVNAETGALD